MDKAEQIDPPIIISDQLQSDSIGANINNNLINLNGINSTQTSFLPLQSNMYINQQKISLQSNNYFNIYGTFHNSLGGPFINPISEEEYIDDAPPSIVVKKSDSSGKKFKSKYKGGNNHTY